MVALINTLIYLLAIMGIIFTTICFIEIVDFTKDRNFKSCDDNNKAEEKIEVIIKIKNKDKDVEKELIKKILEGDYKKLEDIVDLVKIEK